MNHSFWLRLPMILALLAALGGLVLEFTVLRGYASHWWNHIPAFYLLYGALAAFVLGGVSMLGSKLLNRPVDASNDQGKEVA